MRDNNFWEELKTKKIAVLDKELQVFTGKLDKIRGNHFSLELVRGLMVHYKNQNIPLKQLASITGSAAELSIQTDDSKALSAITKTIINSDLGLTPIKNTKQTVLFAYEVITNEGKKKLAQIIKTTGEEGEIAFRRVRDEMRSSIRKEKNKNNISDEQRWFYEKETDKLVGIYHDKLKLVKNKKLTDLGFKE